MPLPFVHLPVLLECTVVLHDLIQGEQYDQQLSQVLVHRLQGEGGAGEGDTTGALVDTTHNTMW